jgi:predicted PurR-regulated permease PerM
MAQPNASKAPDLPLIQSACYFSLTLVSWFALLWGAQILGHYFANIVMLIGLVILMVYLLLAPVNVIHRLLKKPVITVFQNVPLPWLSAETLDHLSRAIAILIVYLVFFLFVSFMSLRFVPVVVNQLGAFLTSVPTYIEDVEDWLSSQSWIDSLLSSTTQNSRIEPVSEGAVAADGPDSEVAVSESSGSEAFKGGSSYSEPSSVEEAMSQGNETLTPRERLKKNIEGTNSKIQGYLASHINDGLSNIVGFLGTTLTGLVYALTALVLTFYCLLDGRKLRDGFLSMMVDESHRETADFIMTHFHRLMFAFVKSQLMLGIATGIFMTFVYTMFGVPYAIFLGAFFAIAEIIPVVGTWIGFTPGILVLLFMDPIKLLIVMGICYVFQTIKDNIVAPQVVGDALGVHPVIVILSLLICAQVGGLLGIVFAIPLASLMNVLWEYGKEKARLATSS